MRPEDQEKIQKYIQMLQLVDHHAMKGAMMGQIYQSPQQVDVDPKIYEGGKRPAIDCIYYMLMNHAVTEFNNLKSPKQWQYCDGVPQLVCIIDTQKNTCEELLLGDPLAHADLAKKMGKSLVQSLGILPHQWVSAKLTDPESFSLMTCVVCPGFDPRDFTALPKETVLKVFPQFIEKLQAFFSNEKAMEAKSSIVQFFKPHDSTALPKPIQQRKAYDYLAPDTAEIRLLLQGEHSQSGGLCHCTLPPGKTSLAAKHRSVEELWYFTAGTGELWLKSGDTETVHPVQNGFSISIPVGVSYQFRNLSQTDKLEFLVTTMPHWPGPEEAIMVPGKWQASISLQAKL